MPLAHLLTHTDRQIDAQSLDKQLPPPHALKTNFVSSLGRGFSFHRKIYFVFSSWFSDTLMEISAGVLGSDSQTAGPSMSLSLMFSQETADQGLSKQFGPHVRMAYKVDADSEKQRQRRYKKGPTLCDAV